jgi:hypothetical protein
MSTVTLDSFKPYVQPDVQGVDIITLQNNIRFTIDEFCKKTWLLQKGFSYTVDAEDIDTDMFDSVVVSTQHFYQYHRPFAIANFKVDGQDWRLKYEDIVNDTSYLDFIRNEKFTGTKIYSFFSTYLIRIAPLSTSQEIYIKPVFRPLQNFTQVDEKIFDWVEAISAGTKARILSLPSKPWTNLRSAADWQRLYRSKITQAKQEIRKDHTNQSKSVYPREFGYQ